MAKKAANLAKNERSGKKAEHEKNLVKIILSIIVKHSIFLNSSPLDK